jgi:hypothetical protein
MQQAAELILQVGQFAMLVIAVCVALMLLVSIIDRHPRDKRSRDDRDRTE